MAIHESEFHLQEPEWIVEQQARRPIDDRTEEETERDNIWTPNEPTSLTLKEPELLRDERIVSETMRSNEEIGDELEIGESLEETSAQTYTHSLRRESVVHLQDILELLHEMLPGVKIVRQMRLNGARHTTAWYLHITKYLHNGKPAIARYRLKPGLDEVYQNSSELSLDVIARERLNWLSEEERTSDKLIETAWQIYQLEQRLKQLTLF